MRITNPDLLKKFLTPGLCEHCRRPGQVRDPAHIFSRGAGHLDVSINLVSLCRDCHTSNHQQTDGKKLSQDDLVVIAAKRDGVQPSDLVAVIWFIRRLVQGSSKETVEFCIEAELSISQTILARKTLLEAKVL